VSLRKRYLEAVHRRTTSGGPAELSPSVLSQACVDVLPLVEGAGISMAQKALRVPLGWSSDIVGAAERVQTTLGSGPCLSAVYTGTPLAADAAMIATLWPVYAQELARLTRYRSVASIPLRVDDKPPFGALDLYASSADLSSTLELSDVADAMAKPIAIILAGAFTRLYDDDPYIPEWLDADPAVDRMTVWTAVGMLMSASRQSDEDALATLRAWAYSHGRTLDEVAQDLVDRVTPLEAVLGD
jgi:ANTAR domain